MMSKRQIITTKQDNSEKSGFTLIEVMLVLGLSGLLLVGLIVNTFSSINTQRYNDSVNSFAEFLRSMYSETISPQSLGSINTEVDHNNTGGRSSIAILGKIMVFGAYNGQLNETEREQARSVYYATLVGNAALPQDSNLKIEKELQNANLEIYCGQKPDTLGPTTVRQYLPPWDGELGTPGEPNARFTGTILMVQSPSSSAVHTFYTKETFDLLNSCKEGDTNAAVKFKDYFKEAADNHATNSLTSDAIGICIKSPSINPGLYRKLVIAADGRNTSAVNLLDLDNRDNNCR